MTRILVKIVFAVLLALIVQEAVLRCVFPIGELTDFSRSDYPRKGSEELQSSFFSNRKFVWKSYPDTIADFVHDLNYYGFRDRDWKRKKKPGQKRIIFIGDSFVESLMAGQNSRLTDGFSRECADPSIEIMNMGILGITLQAYIELFSDVVPAFTPDEVFLVMYANDFWDTQIDRVEARQLGQRNLIEPRIIPVIEGIKNNEPVTSVFDQQIQPFVAPVPSQFNPWTRREEQFRQHCTPEMAVHMKAGNLNYFRLNMAVQEEKLLRTQVSYNHALRWMKTYAENRQTKLRIVYIPSRHQVTDYYYQFEKEYCQIECPDYLDMKTPAHHDQRRQLSKDCSALELPLLDLTEYVKSFEDQDKHLYWNYDDHMRGKGYLLLGEQICRWSQELN